MSDTVDTPRRYFYQPKRNGRRRNQSHNLKFSSADLEFEPEVLPQVLENADAEGPSQGTKRRRARLGRRSHLNDPYIRIAMYVAMAHAGLALSFALLFSGAKLLQNYWRPIQWAILCSIPLREVHQALVSFWSDSLILGLFQTLIAIPLSALNATNSSLLDSHAAFLRLLNGDPSTRKNNIIGFSKLMQWLISFGLFVILHERIGILSIPAIAIPCFIAYATGWKRVTVKKLTSISSRKLRSNNNVSYGLKVSRYLTSFLLNRLKTTVGIGLIMFMILGSVSGLGFFSYKIAMEGKDAVVSLKANLDESNLAERLGVKKWMDENNAADMIDSYATKFYGTMLQNVDSLAEHYNVTEIVDGVKHYLVSRSRSWVFSSVPARVTIKPLSDKLYSIQSRVRNGEWKMIYKDFDGLLWEFVSLVNSEDLLEKIKSFLLQSLDVSKQLLVSSSMVLTTGLNILFFMAVSIVSGAAELLNFVFELMVFLWLLYYLMTSNSGGVMDHVLGMMPISKSTRVRCAQVLDDAITSVLLAAAKVTIYEACLTYLLFRFYHIHFLYMSTFVALMTAILPITPSLLSSLPAAAQLAMEARYIEAILLTVIHQILLECGTAAIQAEIPGQTAYLTGLSILGGIALFPSALEGAIMGPLLMTVMIALKNLYAEFVLGSANVSSQ